MWGEGRKIWGLVVDTLQIQWVNKHDHQEQGQYALGSSTATGRFTSKLCTILTWKYIVGVWAPTSLRWHLHFFFVLQVGHSTLQDGWVDRCWKGAGNYIQARKDCLKPPYAVLSPCKVGCGPCSSTFPIFFQPGWTIPQTFLNALELCLYALPSTTAELLCAICEAGTWDAFP